MGLIGIVEDDPLFAADLESRLRMSADVENVRRWGSAEGYLEYLEAGGTAPSLLMLDLGLPGLGGLDLLRRIVGERFPWWSDSIAASNRVRGPQERRRRVSAKSSAGI
jgi:DNA-binding NarL/FixJ family response regulator